MYSFLGDPFAVVSFTMLMRDFSLLLKHLKLFFVKYLLYCFKNVYAI